MASRKYQYYPELSARILCFILFNEHGPSACAMGFKTRDAAKAFKRRLSLVQNQCTQKVGPMELNIPAIKGIGGMPIFLVDRDIYENDFVFFDDAQRNPEGAGLKRNRSLNA